MSNLQGTQSSAGKIHRIGLFGGTFDPIHFGHLRPAIEVLERFKLEQLHLLPNHRPAHRGEPRANTAQRIQMLKMAVAGQQQLVVDAREARRDKASYTFDTLSEYRELHPKASLIFFMGMDAFSAFDSWHRWQDILKLANLVVVNRPNAQLSAFAQSLIAQQQSAVGNQVVDAHCGAIERCDVTQLAISATDIRAACSEGRSIDYLLPEAVKQFIEQNNLYGVLK